MYDFQKFYKNIQTSLKDAFPEKEFAYKCSPGETITVCMGGESGAPKLNDVRDIANRALNGMGIEEIFISEATGGGGIDVGAVVVWLAKRQYFSLSHEDSKSRDVYINVGRRCDEPKYPGWQEKYIDFLKLYFGFNINDFVPCKL